MYICAKNNDKFYPIFELNLKSLNEVVEAQQSVESGGYLKQDSELDSLLVQLNQDKIFKEPNSKLENSSQSNNKSIECEEVITAGTENKNLEAVLNKVSNPNSKKFIYNPTKIGKTDKSQNYNYQNNDKHEITSKLVTEISNEFIN